ncbi:MULTISPECIES: hypothetical protein [unclassified Roseovarius]|uniref:hypothetical protein n=1 Tax=unclassified Roseovarius TaxID=2614913 RepID=UPI00273DA441|nr:MULTISPECIES: hypothetical protein [unclassified Roseovarius]
MHPLLATLFPRTFWAQVMLGLFLALVFLIPAMFIVAFWPEGQDAEWWKIVAVSGSAVSAGILLPTYFFFAIRLTEREAQQENDRED